MHFSSDIRHFKETVNCNVFKFLIKLCENLCRKNIYKFCSNIRHFKEAINFNAFKLLIKLYENLCRKNAYKFCSDIRHFEETVNWNALNFLIKMCENLSKIQRSIRNIYCKDNLVYLNLPNFHWITQHSKKAVNNYILKLLKYPVTSMCNKLTIFSN